MPSQAPTKVTSGDPFAALDAKSGASPESDEFSSRFPSLDQFSLLHDHGTNFDFDSPTSPQSVSNGPTTQLNRRVAEHLADDAFARPPIKSNPVAESHGQASDSDHAQSVAATAKLPRASPPLGPPYKPTSASPRQAAEKSKASTIISNNPELQAISSTLPQSKKDAPSKPIMVSTGTMTSPPVDMQAGDYPPIHRFPPGGEHRSTSLPRQQIVPTSSQTRLDANQIPRPSLSPRVPSVQSQSNLTGHASSSRPSLEVGRPSAEYIDAVGKSSLNTGRSRPASMYLESSMDYLREREAAIKPSRTPGYPSPKIGPNAGSPRIEPQDESTIESNVEFLRTMEDHDSRKREKIVKQHSKRSSLTSLSGTKNILAGKFGDAFKRFEGNPSGSSARTPSPLKDRERYSLTPIAGSEATDGRSDDGHFLIETELSPEMRREIEAQSLADEERRVEAAAAEYKLKTAAREAGDPAPALLPRSIGGVSRASSIQNRVQNLLEESQKSAQQIQRTASGYGKFSDAAARSREEKELPGLPPRPGTGHGPPPKPPTSSSEALARARSSGQGHGSVSRLVPPIKPNPAPKPTHLNSLPTGGRRSPTKQRFPTSHAFRASSDQLVGVGLPGRPMLDMTFQEKEDYIQDFSKRFPSLSSIEMVERDIDAEVDRKGGR